MVIYDERVVKMKYTVGFIGVGNMGGALLESICKVLPNDKICFFDVSENTSNLMSKKTGANPLSLKDVVQSSKYLFLGVKPNIVESILSELKEYITNETVIVSMAAGTSIDKISRCSDSSRIIRIMPNTPVSVGQGMILYCIGETITEEDLSGFKIILEKAGVLDCIDEKLIDAASALSGCGPAFVYMFIDALADGAVKCGLSRDKALLYAKQTVYGSAFMTMNTDKHLGKLKDDVCSPGGTTIEGVLALEKGAFRSTTSSAVTAAFEKTSKL